MQTRSLLVLVIRHNPEQQSSPVEQLSSILAKVQDTGLGVGLGVVGLSVGVGVGLGVGLHDGLETYNCKTIYELDDRKSHIINNATQHTSITL